MSQLPTTHPYIYEELMKGHFGIQRQNSHGFAQVACDMSIEQTVNRDTKTRGGVNGFSNNQGATNRWVRSHWSYSKIVTSTPKDRTIKNRSNGQVSHMRIPEKDYTIH